MFINIFCIINWDEYENLTCFFRQFKPVILYICLHVRIIKKNTCFNKILDKPDNDFHIIAFRKSAKFV